MFPTLLDLVFVCFNVLIEEIGNHHVVLYMRDPLDPVHTKVDVPSILIHNNTYPYNNGNTYSYAELLLNSVFEAFQPTFPLFKMFSLIKGSSLVSIEPPFFHSMILLLLFRRIDQSDIRRIFSYIFFAPSTNRETKLPLNQQSNNLLINQTSILLCTSNINFGHIIGTATTAFIDEHPEMLQRRVSPAQNRASRLLHYIGK